MRVEWFGRYERESTEGERGWTKTQGWIPPKRDNGPETRSHVGGVRCQGTGVGAIATTTSSRMELILELMQTFAR